MVNIIRGINVIEKLWWKNLSDTEWLNVTVRQTEEIMKHPDFPEEVQRRKIALEVLQQKRRRELQIEQAEIDGELKKAGVAASLSDMDMTGVYDQRSYPVLAKHLENHNYSDFTLWPMIAAFRNNRAHGKGMTFKLEQLARSGRYSPQVTAWFWDAVAENLTSRDHARLKALSEDTSIFDRDLFFRRLRLTKHPDTREILQRSISDPTVAIEAKEQLRLLEKAEHKRAAAKPNSALSSFLKKLI